MIPFDFVYYRPQTVEEAVNQFQELRSNKKEVIYYSGGTEFISRARRNELQVDAVIDLKHIPDCRVLKQDPNHLVFGSAITLTEVVDTNLFPLLTQVVRQIATQTERNKITIGGNICSHLPYREALLPFLLVDCRVVIAGKTGIKSITIADAYQNGLKLAEEEFIVQFIIDQKFTTLPHFSSKQTKQSKVNYPIVSLASMQVDGKIRTALSGVCQFPFLLQEIEMGLNPQPAHRDKEMKHIINHLPAIVLNDLQASSAYRTFVLKNALTDMLERIGSK